MFDFVKLQKNYQDVLIHVYKVDKSVVDMPNIDRGKKVVGYAADQLERALHVAIKDNLKKYPENKVKDALKKIGNKISRKFVKYLEMVDFIKKSNEVATAANITKNATTYQELHYVGRMLADEIAKKMADKLNPL